MKKTLKLKNITSLAPLLVLFAYSIGFIIFLFYFIDEGAIGKTNILSYLTPSDHIVIFAAGIILFIYLFLSLVLPSIIIQTLEIEGRKTKFILKGILYFSLGRILSFFIIALLQNKYPDSELLLEAWVHIVIFIIAIVFIMLTNKLFNSAKDKKGLIVVISLALFVLLVVFFDTSIIKLSGYGNRWACLSLTAKEGESIMRNPEFNQLFKSSSDKASYFTVRRVFIVLQLKDYIFIDNRTDNENKNLAAIEVIPMSEARIFNVGNKKVDCKSIQ